MSASIAIIGAGPAGLMAAEVLSTYGYSVDLYDAMPTPGRKFLLAGRGGLNLTHSEPLDRIKTRYSATQVADWLSAFGPDAVRAWATGLGTETFIGSSGRVFPVAMKAAPLLRAWLARLHAQGVRLHARHRWQGWTSDGALSFATPNGTLTRTVDATLLALGGGSWARFGSDGAWVPLLTAAGIAISPLRPANCGFDIAWSEHFRDRYAGQPLKTIALAYTDRHGVAHQQRGECVVTATGLEGSLIYAHAAALRDLIERDGHAQITLDLHPDRSPEHIHAAVSHPRGARSWASHLQSRLGLKGVKASLLREVDPFTDTHTLAQHIKALPLTLIATRPLDEAISTAGGVSFSALDAHLMLTKRPGTFCAGEMLDWEAPTGGYLLTACLASGRIAAEGIRTRLASEQRRHSSGEKVIPCSVPRV
jgi:uncharacterized flavoprotein (TIGR03862 family)